MPNSDGIAKMTFDPAILWLCQSFSNCYKKGIFCLLENCFSALFVLYARQFTYDLDEAPTHFNNMNTIFVTYFVSATCVKCCIQMKGYIQYCLDGFFWVCRSWPNPGTTIPTLECETCCSPIWIRHTNPQVSSWKKPHICQCEGIQSCPWPMWLWDMMVFRFTKAIDKNFPLCSFALSYFFLT